MLLIMMMLGSLPFVELSSVRKYAICSLMTGPLIFMGTMQLCHGGILSDDLTLPIFAFCSQLSCICQEFSFLLHITILFFVPGIRNRELFLYIYAKNKFCIW